jgi:hypothetical protein
MLSGKPAPLQPAAQKGETFSIGGWYIESPRNIMVDPAE